MIVIFTFALLVLLAIGVPVAFFLGCVGSFRHGAFYAR